MRFIIQLLNLLSFKQTKSLIYLQLLIIIMSFTELLGIASILPFMTIVTDPTTIESNKYLRYLFEMTEFSNLQDFIILLGVVVVLLLGLSAAISIITIWRLSVFANQTGTELADTLYRYYMGRNWMFHSNINSSLLTKQITQEVSRFTGGILQPLLTINAKIVFVTVVVISLLFFNPGISIAVSLIISVAYISIYRLVSSAVKMNGSHISKMQEKRYKIMNDTFLGVKELILLGRTASFINSFSSSGRLLAKSEASNFSLAHLPRYFIEFVGFGITIGLIILLLSISMNVDSFIPILSLYAIAAFKLLPACQQIYYSTVTMRGNHAALEEIESDLKNAKIFSKNEDNISCKNQIKFNDVIKLNEIEFKYPNAKHAAVSNINIEIKKNQMIGIAGESGAGKSTIIDILMGLLEPDNGTLTIDNNKIDHSNLRKWQNCIGLVPQNVILLDATVAENICFGLTESEISEERIIEALHLSNLYDFVMSLEFKLKTLVGENGVKFSGGQRQRLGIARALYHNPPVLVFDEATSALDNLNEKKIIENINMLKDQKTIITIAHRLSTIKSADKIYFFSKGKIVGKGSYQELYNENIHFKKLADLS